MTIRLRGINLHPVKSTAIRPVEQAYVGVHGLAGDREWMIVDADGAMITARDLPPLFRVVADNRATGVDADLRLSAPDAGAIEVAVPTDGELLVRLFSPERIAARPVAPEVDAWLSRAVGVAGLRLVHCDDPTRRDHSEDFGREVYAGFHDDSPVSLLTDASVAALDSWTDEPMVAERFRANLLVEGADEAFAEDHWTTISIGAARLAVLEPIARCSMTTIDPDTLRTGKEPIRTLAEHRKWNGQTWFAVHLAVEEPGEIAVGDELVLG